MTLTDLDWDSMFDAEILVERAGCARFALGDIAALLDLHPHSIWKMVARGEIAQPTLEFKPGRGGNKVAYWTCGQATEALALRLADPRIRGRKKAASA